MLAVKVDFPSKQATIGTRAGETVPTAEIMAALETIGYQGQLVGEQPAENDSAGAESDAP